MPLIDYKGLLKNTASSGAGGVALDQNFQTIGDRIGPCNTNAARDPLPTDDSAHGYYKNSRWTNQSTKMIWDCVDDTPAAAIWRASGIGMDGKLLASTIPNPIEIIFAQGTQAELNAAPALASGKPGWTTDTHNMYVGAGSANVQIGGTVWPTSDFDIRWDPTGNGGLGSGDGVRINSTGLVRKGDPSTPNRPLILQSMGVGSIIIQGSTVTPLSTGTGNIDIQPSKTVGGNHGVYSGNEGLAIGNRIAVRGGNISIGNDLTDSNQAHTGTINIGFGAGAIGTNAINIGKGFAHGQDGINIGPGTIGTLTAAPSVRVGGGIGVSGTGATVLGAVASAENVVSSSFPGTAPNNGTLTTPGDVTWAMLPSGYLLLYEISNSATPFVVQYTTITFDGVNTVISGFTPGLPSGSYTATLGVPSGFASGSTAVGRGSLALALNTVVVGLFQQGKVAQGIYMPSPVLRRPKGLGAAASRLHNFGGSMCIAQSDRVDFKVNGATGNVTFPTGGKFIPILAGVIVDDSPTAGQITGQPSYKMGWNGGTGDEIRASAAATQFGLANAEFFLSPSNISMPSGIGPLGTVTAPVTSSLANVWGRFVMIGIWTEL